jgi:hypothetical protein
MKLAFEKLLETNDLEISDLPKITQVEIKELTQLKSLIVSKMNIGQNVTPATLQKIKDKDNAIVDDILEYLGEDEDEDDTDDNLIDRFSDDDDTDEDNNDNNEDEDEDDTDEDNMDAITIDKELHNLFKSGATICTLSDLRNYAPMTYECIFDTYGQDEENGINTSNYTIVETSLNSEKFKILKK